MASPYSDLQSKTEAALKAEVEQVSLTNRGDAVVYMGLDTDQQLGLPRIECRADQGNEDPPESGNRWMDCEIVVISSANESLATHRSRCKYVFDQFAKDWDTICQALTGRVTDFTAMGLKDRTTIPQQKDERHVMTGEKFQLLCCPKDF